MSERGGDDDWTAAIEAVLTADTADLRTLAKIANADPRTFYIGTPLDGTDLRGQDLRGMLLPNLDRDRVRTDAATKLDPIETEIDPDDEALMRRARVLVGPRLWAGVLRSKGKGMGAALFAPNEMDHFLAVAREFAGPKLVVVSIGDVEFIDHLAGGLPHDILILVYDRDGGPRPMEAWVGGHKLRSFATILVPFPQDERAFGGGAGAAMSLPTVLSDAIEFCSLHWREVSNYARERRRLVFLRARASRHLPSYSIWGHLFSRAATLGLSSADGLRSDGGFSTDRARETARLLFPRVRTLSAGGVVLGSRFGMAAVFDPTTVQDAPEMEHYLETSITWLSNLGWYITKSRRSEAETERRMAGGRGRYIWGVDTALTLSNRNDDQVLHLDVESPTADVRAGRYLSVQDARLDHVQRLVLTEQADAVAVVQRLAEHHELCVSVRDLAAMDESAGASLWLLIAAQALRLGSSRNVTARTAYLAILTLEGLRHPHAPASRSLEDRLHSPEFTDHFRIQVIGIAKGPGGVAFDLVMASRKAEKFGGDKRYRLRLTKEGPEID
ncbi:hypothetical protein [Caulobacter sp. Root1472]|uniref:hypothetical protein n=1 Tax=Caulobacter sp. Root1472 TaxID=1736470 RepID=UPI0006F78E19|nr:hypothetical protein [Caulobacter sp. Root1472]KQZ33803.1 hypothetical protein ASD47_01650 [Caulobacter sp. Root1472]